MNFSFKPCIFITMILVTGGTGLVGSHLLLKLTEQDVAVTAIYRSKHRVDRVEEFFAFAKAESQYSKITWIQADITDIPQLTAAFTDVKTVYHCAALISFDPYDFDRLIKTNVEGTANVVNLCLANDVKKLCHLSSIAILSKLPNTPITEENHWDPNEENSVYAISKYGAETEVWRASQEGLDVLIFNPGVILGEGPLDEGSGALFKSVLKNSSYYPEGATAFVDVQDLVEIMIQGMASSIKNERFVATVSNHSFKEVLDTIAANLSRKAPNKEISEKKLRFLATLDSLRGVFTGKRKLTKAMISSISSTKTYTHQKLKDQLSFIPQPIEKTIQRVALYHKKSM